MLLKLKPLIKSADDLTNTSKMVKYLDEAFDAALPSIVQYLTHPKVQQFLTKAGVPDVIKWVAKSIREVVSKINPAVLKAQFNDKANSLKEILNTLSPLLPASAGPRLKSVLDGSVAAASDNLLIYGLGGLIVPFIFIKLIDLLLVASGLA